MNQQQQSRWRPTSGQLLWASGIGAVLTVAVLIGYRYDITLWDWIKLLIVPAVIAGGGLWFNSQQREREQRIANERAQDEALQAYLDQMSDMLIPSKDLPSLYKARPGDSLSSVARARTLTVLSRLDDDRKGRVVQFLYEAGLISKGRRILDLSGADLSGANFSQAHLTEADLSGASLTKANLLRTSLSGVNLSRADLREATPVGANLTEANLYKAELIGAYFYNADLSGANLEQARLMSFATVARLRASGTKLAGRNRVDLERANLTGAEGVTNEELHREAGSLKEATMPNGQKYEDWLKNKKASGKDEKNE